MNRVVILETIRRTILSPAFLIALLLLTGVAAHSAIRGEPPPDVFESTLVAAVLTLSALVHGCRVVGPEISAGSAALILLRPITRADYLISRVMGTVLALMVLFAAPAAIVLGASGISHRDVMLHSISLQAVQYAASVLFAVSALALFGSMTRSFYNLGCYFLLIVVFMDGVGAGVLALQAATGIDMGPWLFGAKPLQAVMRSAFVNVSRDTDVEMVVSSLLASAIMLIVGCMVFARRELPLRNE